MNKVQTKRFALTAIVLSIVLCAMAFALLGVRATAKANGEIELQFPTEFEHSCWTQNFRLDLPGTGQALGGAPDSDAVFPGNQTTGYSQVRIERGNQTWNASHIRVDVNDFDLYFLVNGMTYDKTTAVAGQDKLIIDNTFTFTTGAGNFVCSETHTWTYNGSKWLSDYVSATDITVENENALTVNNGATLQLHVSLTPSDADDAIVYEALDNGVSVSATGLVTGKAVGTSQVKITAGSVTKTVSIQVKTPPTVQSISVNGTLEIYQYANITELSQSDAAIAAISGQYNYSDNTTASFDITKDMISGWNNVNTDTAGNYTVKVTKDGKEANATVTVKRSDVLSVVSSGFSSGAVWIMFAGSKSTANVSLGASLDEESRATLERMRPYVQASLQKGTANASDMQMQANYPSGDGNRTINLYWAPGGAVIGYTKGDIITLKKGMPILASERLASDIILSYNGSEWLQLIEPTAITITNKSETLLVNTTRALQITTAPANANGAITFESSNATYASVSNTGVITAHKITDNAVSSVTVTAKYVNLAGQTVSDSVTFAIAAEPAKTGIEIEDEIPAYYVPLNSSFTEQGYELYYHYIYDTGDTGAAELVANDLIDEANFDFTKTGDRELTIKVDSFETTVTVHVYELKTIGWWQDLGVDGYGDDRNKPGQFNGNMLVTARNFSSNAANITGQDVDLGIDEINKMFDCITYTTAGGEEYTRANSKLGGWLLGSTILINAGGKGFTGAPENGYQLGDKITFAKGMPLYGWSGELYTTANDSHTPKEGTGCMYVIGYTDVAYTWFCYDQNDTYSLWRPYVEYTDFTVRDSITVSVDGAGSLGAMFTSAGGDAVTTGYFTYASSDTSVVTVNESGNLVGVKEGTATITITALPIEASGYQKDAIVKTVTVTVQKGIASVSGSFTVKPNAAFDLDKYKITVTYTDGSTEEIALSDSRVQAEEVDTSVKGESTYVVLVTIDGVQKRGTFTVNVKKSGGCGCGSSVATAGSVILGGLGLTLALAAVTIRRKKKEA